MDFRARTVERKDLGAVLAVETASKREVGAEYLAGELQNPLCCFYLVESQPKGKVCAYLLAWQLDENDFEIHHLATLPDMRRRGLARMLVNHLLKVHERGEMRVFLEVRQKNAEAVSFYEAFGFTCIGIRKSYYRNPVEDALVYRYSIPGER